MESKINRAFTDSLIKNEFKGLIADSIEISIDQIIENEVIKEIPIVSSLVSIYKIGVGINERFTIKKILQFLFQLEDIPNEEKQEFLKKLSNDEKYSSTIFEKILIIIDRLDGIEKAIIIGNLFKATILGNIITDVFFKLASIVQRAFIDDLKSFIFYGNGSLDRKEKEKYLTYYTKSAKKNLASLGLLEEKIVETKNNYLNDRIEYHFEYENTNLGEVMKEYSYFKIKNP